VLINVLRLQPTKECVSKFNITPQNTKLH